MKSVVVLLLLLCTPILNAAESNNYRILKSARIFAIGGIGVAGVTTSEETAFNALCKQPDAARQFRSLLREATIEGQMYALLGLRQLHATDYKLLAQPYRHSTRMVNTGAGCEIGRDKISHVVNEWVDKMALK